MATSTRVQQLEHVLKGLDFPESTVKFLKNEGCRTMGKLLGITPQELDTWVQAEAKPFGRGDASTILKLKEWEKEYRKENVTDTVNWLVAFDGDAFDDYRPKTTMEIPQASTIQPHNRAAAAMEVRVDKGATKLKDFPSFGGTNEGWRVFKKRFTAVAGQEGMDYLLKESFDPKALDEIGLARYTSHNHAIYQALRYATAEGFAESTVDDFEESSDGRATWLRLMSDYETHGSVENDFMRTRVALQKLKFTANQPGGLQAYTNEYKALCHRLAQLGSPMPDKEKKLWYLENISDPELKTHADHLHRDKALSFDEICSEMKWKASKMDSGNQRSTIVNASNSYGKETNMGADKSKKDSVENRKTWKRNNKFGGDKKGKGYAVNEDRPFIPKHLFVKMSDDEKKQFYAIFDKMADNNGRAREVNHVNTSDDEQEEENPKKIEDQSGNIFNSQASFSANTVVTVRADDRQAFNAEIRKGTYAIVDGGTDTTLLNEGVWRVIADSGRLANVQGYSSDHRDEGRRIVSTVAVIKDSSVGRILVQINEGILMPKHCNTLLSPTQLRENGVLVDNRARRHGGKSVLEVGDVTIKLHLRRALLIVELESPSDEDLEKLEVVHLTEDSQWDPMSYNDKEGEGDMEGEGIRLPPWVIVNSTNTTKLPFTYEESKSKLGTPPRDVFEHTLKNTTQIAPNHLRFPMRRHLKSRFPALNTRRLWEGYATDTWFASVKSIEGYTCSQLYVGQKSGYICNYGMVSERFSPATLEDFCRNIGAPVALRNDNAKSKTGKTWTQLMRKYAIRTELTEPRHPQQNPAERAIRKYKNKIKMIMVTSGAPSQLWYRCAQHTAQILNCLAVEALRWRTPHEFALGETPDISGLLMYDFYQPVYYHVPTQQFPETREKLGYFCGLAETHGDALTFHILDHETNTMLVRSVIRPVDKPIGRVDHQVPLGTLQSKDLDSVNGLPHFEVVDPFAETPKERGARTEMPSELGEEDQEDPADVDQWIYEAFINEKEQEEGEPQWRVMEILSHRSVGDKGIEIEVQLASGNVTWFSMGVIKKACPYKLTEYAVENNLTGQTRWRWAKVFANQKDKMLYEARVVNNANQGRKDKFKFGYEVPRSVKHALELDKREGNHLWSEAIEKERKQVVDEYSTFKVLPKGARPPDQYQYVPLHWVFDVKSDGRHKARMVAGGNVTSPVDEDVYSSVVSLETLRLLFLIAATNKLKILVADIGNAYLNSKTQEKIYTIGGDGFGTAQGSVLVFEKALYGLRTSAARWHEHLADTLRDLGFKPCKADHDTWLRISDNSIEYIAVWVDDIIVVAKDPEKIMEALAMKYKMTGISTPQYYLGADIRFRHGMYEFSAETYIKRICEKVEKLLGVSLHGYGSPLLAGDHPEIDTSTFLDPSKVSLYRMMIGSVQWAVSLGRYDVYFAVNTLSRFNHLPREGHLNRILRVLGYLKHHSKGRVVVNPNEPDMSCFKITECNWSRIYPDAEEEYDRDVPKAVTKEIVTTAYVDADHAHDLVTRRSVTGVFVVVNLMPVIWYSKRQATVESATYGSELVATRIATDYVVALRYKMRMLGMRVDHPTYMLGDNQAVVQNLSLPSSVLKKKHNAIAYHRVREAVAAGIVRMSHIRSGDNIADVLTKALGHVHLWPKICRVMFGRFCKDLNKREERKLVKFDLDSMVNASTVKGEYKEKGSTTHIECD